MITLALVWPIGYCKIFFLVERTFFLCAYKQKIFRYFHLRVSFCGEPPEM